MARVAERLDTLTVRGHSPDQRIHAQLSRRREIEFVFDDEDAYYEYETEAELARQLSALLNGVMAGYRDGRKAALEAATGRELSEGPHWDAQRRRFREERERILATGFAADRKLQIDAVGLRDWEVIISPGAAADWNHEQICSLLPVAFKNLLQDYRRELHALKEEVYGRVGVRPDPM